MVTDVTAIVVGFGIAYLVRFDADGGATVSGAFSPTYFSVSFVLAAIWFAALAVGHTRDRRVVGSGPGEYARVLGVSWRLFAAIAVVAYLLHMQVGRAYLAVAAPIGIGLMLVGRYVWRLWLRRRRRVGQFRSGVVVVGPVAQVRAMIAELRRTPDAGYGVVGVCLPGEPVRGAVLDGVPVLGGVDDAADAAELVGATAVAVTGSDTITTDTVRHLGWDLEGRGIDLALTLSLADVAGPRVLMQPVNGLPLVYVDEARFSGRRYVAKALFDVIGAAIALLLLSPVLLVAAALVRLTSRGPVFFRQERIGKDGEAFRVLKFRSMVDGAHDSLEDVLALEGVSEVGLYYKPRHDPRVTRVGRVLRKYSIDELPQLFNVLRGQMSLVGPRPQIAAEVALYDDLASRRLLVKPGMTGLWQVSGRSEVSPEDAIRLDVRYAENWSLVGDVLILFRTLRAIVRGSGAY